LDAITLHKREDYIRFRFSITMENGIKEALVELLDGIRRADGDAIASRMALLDDYLVKGRSSLHPQLVHFLENRSYPKALMFLGGEHEIPAGACGGGR
jgi:hypothetical protein